METPSPRSGRPRVVIGARRRRGHEDAPALRGHIPGDAGEPAGHGPAPLRDVGRQHAGGCSPVGRQHGQVVHEHQAALRCAPPHLRRDLQEVLPERPEALLGQVRVGVGVQLTADRRDGPHGPRQAGQQDPGGPADVVATAREGHQLRGRCHRVDLGRAASGSRGQDVLRGRAGKRNVVQLESETPGDQVRIVGRRAPRRPGAAGGTAADTRAGRERTSHRDVAGTRADVRRRFRRFRPGHPVTSRRDGAAAGRTHGPGRRPGSGCARRAADRGARRAPWPRTGRCPSCRR